MPEPSKTHADKRQAILQATLQLLSERGFHGFSMKQLAERAGVAAGTIYLYFEDREDLICQLHDEVVGEIAEHAFRDHDQEASVEVQFRGICRNIWHFGLQKPEVMLNKGQFDHLPPDVLRSRRESAERVFAPFSNLLEHGRRTKLFKDLPHEVLIALCIDPLCSLVSQYRLGLIDLNDADLEHMLDATWDAITL